MTDRNWDEVLHEFTRTGGQYAKAKAERVKAEAIAKSVKAESYLRARADDRTVTDADAVSRTDPDYIGAVQALVAAVEDEEAKSIKVEALRLWMEWARTLEATRREEMRLAR